ncbi:transglutaminase-like domain-containing protein [Robertkochia solimangrovi]|uniref:transglutaminase-like domain-containing protein n=1 Tax=Robertkochia solimangrovi TaxID=2213046 RepID=UPI00117ECE4E|nr:transglutaminase family protein [Robertkochia solimangrovi]TRZ45367.1 transglutaminase family protein [Robertkochia solimangrovi]
MSLRYQIEYSTTNIYENEAEGAKWQFLLVPQHLPEQQLLKNTTVTSVPCVIYTGINAFGFETLMVSSRHSFTEFSLRCTFDILKEELNPFDLPMKDTDSQYQIINSHEFKVDHLSYIRSTSLTHYPSHQELGFKFDRAANILDNLIALNKHVHDLLEFQTMVTDVNTTLDMILHQKKGVCQDFTHLFCALARGNAIPCRYVSGYLHQGVGFTGELQMHAWAEALIPGTGWIGFDPTNNILTNHHHVKVCHGRDYRDCAPIKGVVYTSGTNSTSYNVQVITQQ